MLRTITESGPLAPHIIPYRVKGPPCDVRTENGRSIGGIRLDELWGGVSSSRRWVAFRRGQDVSEHDNRSDAIQALVELRKADLADKTPGAGSTTNEGDENANQ